MLECVCLSFQSCNPVGSMTSAKPRVFIADFDLIEYSGHFFNQVFGYREAARARALETRIYVPAKADPKIVRDLDARAILPMTRWYSAKKDAYLEGFVRAQLVLAPLWSDLERANISEHDILLITSSQPLVVFGVGQWLRARPASARPAVFFRFFAPEFFDFEGKKFNERAWAYHFASRSLDETAGGERTFFTLNDENALAHLEQLSSRKAFYLPVPKYYGDLARSSGHAAQPLTIYIYLNVRSGLISDRIAGLIESILSRHADTRFLVRFTKNARGEDDLRRRIDASPVGHKVEIIPSEQSHIDYLATIERSDVIVLPYSPVEYRGIVSGVFCEIAAMAKISVIPDRTWMADHVTDGRAAAVLFRDNSVADMVEAVECAIRDRDRLQVVAERSASVFREEYSCERSLDGMIRLAAERSDMRLSYVPLTDATNAFGSQHYFGDGWALADEGFGTWSDGEHAEINFSIAPGAPLLFFSVLVRPFLAKSQSRLEVSLTANDVAVADWSFDARRAGDRVWSWRHVPIPETVAASGKIRIAMTIRSPVSPQMLGMSVDSRKLGIAIRRFSLKPEMEAPDIDSSERPSVRARLQARIKRTMQALSSAE